MKYMLMMHVNRNDSGGVVDWPAQDIKNHIAFQHEFDRGLRDAGEMVFNAGLTFPDQARIVRSTDGTPAVTDGPFPESKEFLIGFWIVDVASEQRAYEIAAKASAAPGVGGAPLGIAIEVRPIGETPPADA